MMAQRIAMRLKGGAPGVPGRPRQPADRPSGERRGAAEREWRRDSAQAVRQTFNKC